MREEIDFGLDSTQWETLKALGAPDPDHGRLDQLALQQLAAKGACSGAGWPSHHYTDWPQGRSQGLAPALGPVCLSPREPFQTQTWMPTTRPQAAGPSDGRS
jgi:hypothetical protein